MFKRAWGRLFLLLQLKEHVYVFFCQMPKTKARSGAFQKGAIRQAHGPEQSRRTDVRSSRRQGHVALHHFETAHYCECIGHYKKRHTRAPYEIHSLEGMVKKTFPCFISL